MARNYRTARGKSVDISQILAEGETTRAVGNMNVNARGDILDSQNKTVQTRNDRIKNQYRKQHKTTVVDDLVPTSKRHAKKLAEEQSLYDIAKQYTHEELPKAKEEEIPEVEVNKQPEPVAAPEVDAQEPVNTPVAKGGLAAAIAKARESKQEIMKTERQEVREKSGVTKI